MPASCLSFPMRKRREMPLHTPLEKNQLFSCCAAAVREIATRPHVSAEAFHNQLMLRGPVEVPVLV